MANINISNFFGSSGSTGGMSDLLSDYSSIKNGSYKKLLKANYEAQKASSQSASKAKSTDVLDRILEEKKNPKVDSATAAANSASSDNVSKLSSSVAALQKDSTFEDTENGDTAREKTNAAVKSFVAAYNNTVRSAKESTLSNVTNNVASMMRTTAQNEDKLKEIGINLNDDGTLVLDEKKLASADLNRVHEVFDKGEVTSYGSTVASRLKFAGYGSNTSSGSSTVSDNLSTKNETNTSALSLKNASLALASEELYEKNEQGQYNVEGITVKAKDFVNSYNSMYSAARFSTNSGVSSNLSYIMNRTRDNAGTLSEFGITMHTNGTLGFNEQAFREADMNRVKDFFNNFGSGVATNASLVQHYMNTQADASSGDSAQG